MAVTKKPTKKATKEVKEIVENVENEIVEETPVEETAVEDTVEAPEEDAEDTVEEAVEEAPVVEEPEIVVDKTVTIPKDKMVQIKPNCDHRFYYGTQWFNLQKEVVTTVPEEVKERLQKAGMLTAL